MHDDTAKEKREKYEFDAHMGRLALTFGAFWDSSQDDSASRNKTEGENKFSDSQAA